MRINRQHAFMQVAEVFAQRSTCFRGGVGAAVISGNDVTSVGYNGPPRGEDHCYGNSCPLNEKGGCSRSDHAEYNAIRRAKVKLGFLDTQLGAGFDLYCTYSPCIDCAEYIRIERLDRLFYRYSYRDGAGLAHLMVNSSLAIYRVTPSGMIIEGRTGILIDPETL